MSIIHNGEGNPITPGSEDLRDAIHAELVHDIQVGWDPTWPDYTRSMNLGELRELWDNNPDHALPGALIEIAFHDHPDDTDALKEPSTRTNSLVYAQDTESSSARYITYDRASDSWVRRLIPADAESRPQPAFMRDLRPLRQSRAPVFPFPAPALRVRTLRADPRSRTIEVRVRSVAGARCLRLWQTAGP